MEHQPKRKTIRKGRATALFKKLKNMCLYPRLIKNKRYMMYNAKAPRKGNATAIPCDDHRKLFVAIGCGECIECRKQKAREWQIRLSEELPCWKYKYFITLTFENDELQKLCEEFEEHNTNVNEVARLAVRRFLERWRKKYGKSVKHWLITELGHEGTERIHLHGLIFDDKEHTNEELQELWKYGITYTGDYCTQRTINYIVKYVTKIDLDHKGYKADIFCSAGLGAKYLDNEMIRQKHKFAGKETCQYYTLKNGQKVALPNYYRNKLWTEAQRNKLWTYILDADKTYVRGIECKNISTPKGYANYTNILAQQQKDNLALGYGSTSKEWQEETYRVTFNMLNKKK